MIRFNGDVAIENDNNVVERSTRPIALDLKNALFPARTGPTIIASRISTCKLNAIDPHDCLTEVIGRIANAYPNSSINKLPPGPTQTRPRSCSRREA